MSAHPATAPATVAFTPARSAGCWPSAPCPHPRVKNHLPTNLCHQLTPRSRKSPGSKKPRRSSNGLARYRLRPRLSGWSPWLTRGFVIEQFYEDARQECGLDNFQGRRWDGLHRHLALVMLAYSFLALQRLQLPLPAGKDFPPSVMRSSLPHVHRQVLLWLFQDLVLWFIQTDQIKSFRP